MSTAVLRPTVFGRKSATIVFTVVLSLGIFGLADAATAASSDGQSAQQPTTKEERQAAMAARQAKRKQDGQEPEEEAAEPAEQGSEAPPAGRNQQEEQQRRAQEQQQRQAQMQAQQEDQQRRAQEQQREAENRQREAEDRQRQAEERQQRQAEEQQQRQAQMQAQMQAQQEDQQRRAEERQQRQAEDQQQRQAEEQQQRQAEEQQQRQAEEQQRQAQMQAQQEDQQRQAQEQQRQAEEQQRQAQEQQRQAQEQQRQAEEQQRQAEEQQRQAQVLSQPSARADEAYQGGGNSGPQPVPPVGNGGQAPPSNPVAAPSASAIKANGRDVTDVVFASGGVTRGQYRQVGAGKWEESAAGGGSSFQFQEAGRDDWSVYLRDSSRGVDIQLDLWRKQVLYSQDGGGEKRALYDITAANAGGVPGSNSVSPVVSPVVEPASAISANGRNVTDATYSAGGQAQGHFRQVGPGQWREESSSGGGYTFEEIARDDWSVYLRDSSRGVDIQLDLWRKQVLYSQDGGGEKRVLYDISAAIAGTVPSNTSSQASSNAGTGSAGASGDGTSNASGDGTSNASGGGTSNASGGGNSLFEKDFCWKDSYGRGVGTVPASCPAGRDRIGLLCYTSCPANMKRIGFDCHSVCPSGMRDDGLFCRSSEYARTPYAASPADLFGPSNRERCEKANGSCEKAVGDAAGAIFYAKCKAGYSSWPLGICRPPQPNCGALGMGGQFDLSCAKIVSIGDPVTGSCPAGQQSDGGLCYPVCNAGYTGVGPVCWTGAPSGWVECGMGAAKDSFTCGQIVFGQVSSVGQLAFKIATLPTGAGAVAGAATAASKAERLTKLKEMYQTLKALYKQNETAIENAKLAKKTGTAISDDIALIDDDVITEEDIIRIAAEIAAIADPTGVADATAAYTYPKCSKYKF